MVVSLEYYRNTFQGTNSDDTTLTKALNRAELVINTSINTTILASIMMIKDYETKRAYLNYKNAICSQAERTIIVGVGSSYAGGEMTDVKIGDFSYKISEPSESKVSDSGMITNEAQAYLNASGLLYRGVVGSYCGNGW